MVVTAKSKQEAFQLKGSLFTLTVLQLKQTAPLAIRQQLNSLVAQAPKFFQNAPIVIDLQNLTGTEQEIDFTDLCRALREAGLVPVGVRGGSGTQHDNAVMAGLAVLSLTKTEATETEVKTKKAPVDAVPAIIKSAKVIDKPVRSGQQIYAKDTDLVILSSVSPGAEILADGNIHVYGALRGRALAGVNGKTDARIFCQSMDAELISIAGRYIVNEALSQTRHSEPMQVQLNQGKLEILPLL